MTCIFHVQFRYKNELWSHSPYRGNGLMNPNSFVCGTNSLYSVIATWTSNAKFLMQKVVVMLAVVLNTEQRIFNHFGKICSRGMWRKEVGMIRQKLQYQNFYFFFLFLCVKYIHIFSYFSQIIKLLFKDSFFSFYIQSVIYPENMKRVVRWDLFILRLFFFFHE